MNKIIKSISIQGYKSIKEVDLGLNSLNVLIGANGSGKSNFLSAFEVIKAILRNNLEKYVSINGGAERLLHFGKKETKEVLIALEGQGNKYGYRLIPTVKDSFDFIDINPFSNISDAISSSLNERSPDYGNEFFQTMRNLQVYHFHDTGFNSRIKSTAKLNDNSFLRSDGANLVSVLYLLQQKHSDYYQSIVGTIRQVAPFFKDFVLKPKELNRDTILLEWEHEGSESYFDAGMLSDGTLRFICLAVLLKQPNLPPLILIDEPELGLHPFAITMLAALFRKASLKSQLIISTQSSALVDHLSPEDIIVVDRKNGKSVFSRASRDALEIWLKDYSLGQIWEKNLIEGNP